MIDLPLPKVIRQIRPNLISISEVPYMNEQIITSSATHRNINQSLQQGQLPSQTNFNVQLLPPIFPTQKRKLLNSSSQPIFQVDLQEHNKRTSQAIKKKLETNAKFKQIAPPLQEEEQEYYDPQSEVTYVKENITANDENRKSIIENRKSIIKLNSNYSKIITKHDKQQQMRTKHPSIPACLPLEGQSIKYYDKWYIPYNQRYIKKQRVTTLELKNNPYAKDDKHFYNNLHNVQEWLVYDPFQTRLPADALDLVLQSKRLDSLKEMLKGSKVIHDYKKMLDNAGARVPFFIKQVIEDN